MNRRTFLAASAAVGLGLNATVRAAGANDRIVVGVMGTGGRGSGLALAFQNLPNVEVAYVSDVDPGRMNQAAASLTKAAQGQRTVKTVGDFRKILDDKAVDVLVVAACNHWHAPATILACSASKHVYVEKPCSHNPHEGELMVEAARKNKRKVQMGNQRRSWPKVQEAMQRLKEGDIGRVYFGESWYLNNRPTIGTGKEGPPPEGLDYELWQGPAPRKAFHSNYLHYNWHWFWHWGNGELGNNGVHMIDLCRWGLGVDYPILVSSAVGRYRFQDDQETPDTHVVSFTFGDRKTITWQGHSCNPWPAGKHPGDVLFLGEKGSLVINGGGYTIYDVTGKEEKRKESGPSADALHLGNFLDGIRSGVALNSEIEEAYKSTLLCHLGNIAHRTNRTLSTDATNGHIKDAKDAEALWTREYAKGWEPKV
jgi:predicted dehydrogenase